MSWVRGVGWARGLRAVTGAFVGEGMQRKGLVGLAMGAEGRVGP